MSGYSMCIYVFCMHHSTRFWYKRRGSAVINIDTISYFLLQTLVGEQINTLLGEIVQYPIEISSTERG